MQGGTDNGHSPTHAATTTGPSRTFLRVRLCLGMENDGNDGRNLSFAAWPSYWPGAGTMICSFEYTEPCGANRLLSSSTSPFTVRGLQQRKRWRQHRHRRRHMVPKLCGNTYLDNRRIDSCWSRKDMSRGGCSTPSAANDVGVPRMRRCGVLERLTGDR